MSSSGRGCGGIGGGSSATASGYSYRSKSESWSCPVFLSDDDRLAEQEFITSLKRDIEKEIIDSAAVITHQGNIEGHFNSSEFYFEYTQEQIRGRIVVAGKLIGNSYFLRANLEEIGEGVGFLSTAKEFESTKPAGDYYVVPFMKDHPLAQDNKLHRIGVELINESRKRIPWSITNDRAYDLQYAEVWTLVKIPQHLRYLFQEKGTEQGFEAPEEYNAYEIVYFLNKKALQMYRESGIALEVLKKVSGDEMPAQCKCTLRGLYI
jgi:hypothetical protein